jgi:GNAT superfamily N-acetyltransferase
MTHRTSTVDIDVPPIPLADPVLRRAATEDVEPLKTVLAEAFHEDPFFCWLIPNDDKRRTRLRRFFEIELRHFALSRGRVWTTDDLAGAALSLPPGAWHVPLHATLMEGTAFGVRVLHAAWYQAALDLRHVRGPHYYIRDIGVHPGMQGRGLGSALLRPTLDRCDRQGLPAYLEASSERNAALYERLGFKLTKELRRAGGPPLRLMLRRPHAMGQTMNVQRELLDDVPPRRESW